LVFDIKDDAITLAPRRPNQGLMDDESRPTSRNVVEPPQRFREVAWSLVGRSHGSGQPIPRVCEALNRFRTDTRENVEQHPRSSMTRAAVELWRDASVCPSVLSSVSGQNGSRISHQASSGFSESEMCSTSLLLSVRGRSQPPAPVSTRSGTAHPEARSKSLYRDLTVCLVFV
jgi:hypothetical protein